jgi:hypothetical protein
MAKKDAKKKKDEPADLPDFAESLRHTFERAFQMYSETTGERTRAVIDEMAGAAARIRESLQHVGAADEVAGLRREVEALSRRVAALEAAKPSPPTRRASTGAAAKPAARSTAAKGRSRAQRGPSSPA